MANYAARTNLELLFGTVSLAKWADLDNNKNPVTIDERITWACETATEYVNSRLKSGRYDVPFSSVPKIIVYITAMYAGILLYDSRLILGDSTTVDQVSRHRKEFEKKMRQILAGQLKLLHPTTGDLLDSNAELHPSVADMEPEDETDCPTCQCYSCTCGE